MAKFSGVDAMIEHMLNGNCVTWAEAMMLFGVQDLRIEIFRLKKRGFDIKKNRIPFTKALVRLKQFMTIEPPEDLPHKEILVTEYWIER